MAEWGEEEGGGSAEPQLMPHESVSRRGTCPACECPLFPLVSSPVALVCVSFHRTCSELAEVSRLSYTINRHKKRCLVIYPLQAVLSKRKTKSVPRKNKDHML